MRNIDILTHFEEAITKNGITIFTLKEAEREAFFDKLPHPYRELYLTDEDLNWRISNFATSSTEEILEKIPDNPSIMSGEFSEILCYYIIPEKYLPASHLRPPKWKWKESKNNPAHFTDVILFCQNDDKSPSPDDCLVSIESKARATKPNGTESSLQKAIDDAYKDYVSRLSESLFHIKTRYKDDRNAQAVNQLERFMDVVKYPSFLKHFKAIATVDGAFADDHLKHVTAIPEDIKDTFEVILIRIEDLKGGYELTYNQIPNT
ncbi:Hachiman antiphage defense system protein HamA [Gynurincola endophyticus]|uniref:Hachiman antiphage defense system protein HamA n=1 Tax=Gynurincola endophyticus TaxID=2479004 RepID=UPI000F8D7E05|nr:Hachiman antiphage defense system protein HamA [Gynurincola endophyticus]